ncbi:MAG: ATP synthase subunit I [Pseudomonadota bacterium]|nr:ATP synthase subunit I [Pseudomonadota bacterium]
MLKVALPRPSSDAVSRGDGRRTSQWTFADEDEAAVRPLTRSEAEALSRRQPALSPWWVVLSQVAVGTVLAAAIGVFSGSGIAAQSALYGAAVVVVPGALMARGATSRLSVLSPLLSTVSIMGWATVKMVVSVLMLVLATRIVPGLSWPALLATLVVCMQTYAFALLWRGRPVDGSAAIV